MSRSSRPASLRLLLCLAFVAAAWGPPTARAAQDPPPEDPNPPRHAATTPPDFRPPAPDAPPGPAVGASTADIVANTKLVFQSAPGNDWEIYFSNDDRTDKVRLTDHPAQDIHPALNRGATRIVFASNRTGNYELFAINPDGSGLVQLTFNATDDVYPEWSPDGTRLAFQSYRDGQAEVYVMNADGAGQTRLTNSAGFDGQPAWSPDGTRIAFTAYRNGLWRIWAMQPNGTGQTQVSNQAYSENPAWSPDSTQLAFDADSDSNGWTELWRINADGTGAVQTFVPGDTVDAYAGSWSPEGSYLAFTQVHYIFIEGNWYWYGAYICFQSSGGAGCIGNSDSTEWNPDWRSTDSVSPVSSLTGLPATVPGHFTVRWTGSDVGSGLAGYDVQVATGAATNWQGWLTATTSLRATYLGQGGTTYYFRARARDVAGNYEAWPASHDAVATVENLPPQTSFQQLPAYSPYPTGGAIAVSWGGTDPGASGILHYDVQWRNSQTNTWNDFMPPQTTSTSNGFYGSSGVTYSFRVRATDLAGNVEPWSDTPDTQTTIYAWSARGTLQTNAGVPIQGAAFNLTPSVLFAGQEPGDELYAAYDVGRSPFDPPYTSTLSKAGYGSLPYGLLSTNSNAPQTFAMVLPPANNAIANWGFETGSLSAWQSAGTLAPVITDTLRHTGDYAAQAGALGLFTAAEQITSTATLAHALRLASAADGTLHTAWITSHPTTDVYYSSRPPGGMWSNPQLLGGADTAPYYHLHLAVSSDGRVHLVWLNSSFQISYAVRAANGVWSAPEVVATVTSYTNLALAVDGTGVAHVAWDDSAAAADVLYRQRSVAGTWSATQNVSQSASPSNGVQLVVTPAGVVTVAWHELTGSGRDLYLRQRTGGGWSSVHAVPGSNSAEQVNLVLTPAGVPQLAWLRQGGGGWRYTRCPGAVCAASPEAPVPEAYLQRLLLATGPDHAAHVVWETTNGALWYSRRDPSGAWDAPVSIDQAGPSHSDLALTVGPSGGLHLTWASIFFPVGLWNLERSPSGEWSGVVQVSGYAIGRFALASDPALGFVHLLWNGGLPADSWYLYHQAPVLANASGLSALAQSVSVPATAPYLSFFYQAGGLTDARPFAVTVDDGTGPATVFSATARVNDWNHASVDLAAWAGETVTLTLGIEAAAGQLTTYALVDEVSVGSAQPDTWVTLSGAPSAINGDHLDYVLTYGNRGPVPASGLALTLALDPQLHFVSANPPPASAGTPLAWNTTSNAGVITVTVSVGPGASLYETLTTTASLAPAATELEPANNTASFLTQIIGWLFLPLVGDMP